MKKLVLILGLFIAFNFSYGQGSDFVANYDENNIPNFKLPDPLETFDGRRIKNVRQWEKFRRPELLEFFSHNVYGKVPGELGISSWKVVEESENAIGGKARRKQVDLVFNKDGRTLRFNILVYLPKNVEKAPLFFGYNFYGNHTVINDNHVLVPTAYSINRKSDNRPTVEQRGISSESWQVEKIIDSGYGVATIFCGEVDPDKDDFSDGIHPFFYVNGQQRPVAGEWGTISAWAWGLSRAMDYFEEDNDVDDSKVIVFGHSRLGKTSLWAGATDERFAAVITNNSGCGGAALFKRQFGETVEIMNKSFPHWFTLNFREYNLNEKALPVDQHELIALIAPRPVYVASAEEDKWADPRGEFLAAYYASPVYKLYGKKGISSDVMPSVNQPVQNTIGYHIRTGNHGVKVYDWEQYIKWADEQLFNKK